MDSGLFGLTKVVSFEEEEALLTPDSTAFYPLFQSSMRPVEPVRPAGAL